MPSTRNDGGGLSEAMTERLLRRASELDVAERTSARIAQLRSAAVEAGISPAAFDAALAEMSDDSAQATAVAAAAPSRRRRIAMIVSTTVSTLLVVVVGLGMLVIPRAVARTPIRATVEQTFHLSCLTPQRANQLIQPLLRGNSATVSWNNGQSPNAITIRAPSDRMDIIRAVLDKSDHVGSPACPTR